MGFFSSEEVRAGEEHRFIYHEGPKLPFSAITFEAISSSTIISTTLAKVVYVGVSSESFLVLIVRGTSSFASVSLTIVASTC